MLLRPKIVGGGGSTLRCPWWIPIKRSQSHLHQRTDPTSPCYADHGFRPRREHREWDDQIGSRPSAWSKWNSTGTHVLSGRAGEKHNKTTCLSCFSDVVWGLFFLGGWRRFEPSKIRKTTLRMRNKNDGQTMHQGIGRVPIALHKNISSFQIIYYTFSKDNYL